MKYSSDVGARTEENISRHVVFKQRPWSGQDSGHPV